MRFHKAIRISVVEARTIIGRQSEALSDVVVISRGEQYYDVRAMNAAELEAFIDDLARAEHADAHATTPCLN